jgi:Na+-transporting methylmalonyl-CoA/oxaloacetate decarboxylase gamma subunit
MEEGLFISLVGMAAVFVSLTIIMFLMMAIERVFRSEELAIEESLANGDAVVLIEPEEISVEPEGLVEVAAIALALTAYLKDRGRDMGSSVTINDIRYHTEVGDISCVPTSIEVDGNLFWCAIGQDGLPFSRRTSLWIEPRNKDIKKGRTWRSAYSPSIGGYWARRGWTGRHGIMTRKL